MVVSDFPPGTVPPHEALRQMINGFRSSQLVYVAAELGLADLMKDGPMHYQELAAASGVHPESLYRLLRALCSAGVFTRLEGDCFGLSPLGEHLQTGSTGSLRAWARFSGDGLYQTWGDLLYSTKTGKIAFDARHGMDEWQYKPAG
jgi:hypothetical protein